ncbi:MAG: DUF1559 domain-containing protein [Thermoguttaceae bacterium]|nr:DUF1559 domain-containing protein [Thermoguttaceae bacterium]
MPSPANRRQAFSLLDLLVVIVLNGVLLCLLLPAISRAREATRRAQCTNNLKFLALAIHNYHDIGHTLPVGAESVMASDGVARRVSGFVSLPPYMESSPFHSQIMEENYLLDFNSDSPASPLLATSLPYYLCPSDSVDGAAPTGQGRINYRFSYGDFPVHTANMVGKEPGELGPGKTDICNVNRGAFAPQQWNALSEFTDGISNTIVFSERAISGRDKHNVRSVYVVSGTSLDVRYENQVVETTGDSKTPVDDCLALAPKGRVNNVSNLTLGYWSGWRWSDGACGYTGFMTILPPNALSCLAANEATSGGLIAPSSFHKGGVNCAMADGSVRFISNSIDYTGGSKSDYNSFTLKGKSPHGVWGALGTRSGGEEVTDAF